MKRDSPDERAWYRRHVLSRTGKVTYGYTRFPSCRELSHATDRVDFMPVYTQIDRSLDYDLKRQPVWSSMTAETVPFEGEQYEFASFATTAWDTVGDYTRAKEKARHIAANRPGTTGDDRPTGCLRTVKQWRTLQRRIGHDGERRVRTDDSATLTELVAGHKEGLWSLPVLASKQSVTDKLTWLSSLGYGDFTRAQWEHMSKRDRRARVLKSADIDVIKCVVEDVLDAAGEAA